MTTVDKWQIAAFAWGLVAQSLFLWNYTRLTGWWRSYVGRALWSKSMSLWLLLLIPLVNVWVSYPGEEYAETVAFWIVALAATYQWLAFRRRKKEVRARVPENPMVVDL